ILAYGNVPHRVAASKGFSTTGANPTLSGSGPYSSSISAPSGNWLYGVGFLFTRRIEVLTLASQRGWEFTSASQPALRTLVY
ncbi:MAG: hypothetical protein P8Q84_03410, partial [Luminiphilus sp.]|nr:hypothetical protein [Luminiphilus sp.]